ncbi:MAG: D-2-hydroxyacid dehydrogenase family protein [Janthinobacterium lividum]
MRVAVMDDWQGVARGSTDWSALEARAEVVVLGGAFADEDAAVAALAGFDVIIPMRERTEITAALVRRLPRLRMIAQTGTRAQTMDLEACTAAGVLVCNTGGERSSRGTAELALALLLAAARFVPQGDAAIRAGRFQDGVGVGPVLHGLTLGIIGFGRIGAMMGAYGRALGMEVLAWSPNLTAEKAEAGGAMLVGRDELLARSDAVSLHVVLSARSRGMLGAAELARMKPGAILVNTSRGPLVDEAALLAALRADRIRAALDVFDREPLPADAAIRTAPNTVLTPHLGYGTSDTFRQFYGESVENVLAFLDGAPIRMVNPAAVGAQ